MSQNQGNPPEFNQFIHENDNEIQNIQSHILLLLNSSEFLQNEIKNYITHRILDITKQYNIKEESINIFYDILDSHLLPDNITSDQYHELIKLMHIFKIKSIPKLNNVDIAIDLIIDQQSLNDNQLILKIF